MGPFTSTERPTENTPLLQSLFDLRRQRSISEPHWSSRMPVAQPLPAHRRKRKALIIGININYASHSNPGFRLRYCIEDAHSMAGFLCNHLGFQHFDVRIMTDTTPRDGPTEANISEAMRALVRINDTDGEMIGYEGSTQT
ncbi:hypothetical protein BC826DRAFT_1006096 [Russula brevipes]|nr:hypothetical protein BC826DRAFT_1006096 [Russula brevipes]